MSQANKIEVTLLPDEVSNGIIIAWPDVYKDKSYWRNILETYHQLIHQCLANNKYIIIVTKENVDIDKDLSDINKNLSMLIGNKEKYLYLYCLEYDDIWLRDHGPMMLIDSNGNINFNLAKFNGYGEKYTNKKDKVFASKFIEKYWNHLKCYQKNPLKIFKDLVIEPGNIIFNDNLCILNKSPLLKHNRYDWNIINSILKEAFENFLNKEYVIIDSGLLNGDDTNGHIDNLVRLEKGNKLYYMATTDQSHPDYDVLNDLERQLMNINLDDKYLIPIYHDFDDIVKNSENDILPFSYLNYIRLGNIILMPINMNTSDAKKLEIKNIFKHDNLIFIEAYGLLNEGGGLHCCSMNILYKQ